MVSQMGILVPRKVLPRPFRELGWQVGTRVLPGPILSPGPFSSLAETPGLYVRDARLLPSTSCGQFV